MLDMQRYGSALALLQLLLAQIDPLGFLFGPQKVLCCTLHWLFVAHMAIRPLKACVATYVPFG